MQISVESTPLSQVTADWLIVPLAEQQEFPAAVVPLNESLGGRLTRLREQGDLTTAAGEICEIRDGVPDGPRRVLTVGLGAGASLGVGGIQRALMTAARRISGKRWERVAVAVPELAAQVTGEQFVQWAATAMAVGSVGQGLYRAEPERFAIPQVAFVASRNADVPSLQGAAEVGRVIGEGVNLARECVNRHPGELYPETFARRAEAAANQFGLRCEILDESRLAAERMNSLLAVAQGSDRPPRVVVLEYRGAGADRPCWGLCGKGVTFDSGGLSLKPTDGMKTMKCDMAGAAAVLGAVTTIARLKLPINVLGLLGLVENMPSAKSYKLGDVLTARNGVTIEVLNTDAEGRLVLADVLSYAVDRGVDRLIDLATLTGACMVALGEDVTGVFTNNQAWCDEVLQAARAVGEPAWQLPMFDSFAEQLKSEVADCKNVGKRWGGAITAAKFLEKFVAQTPWVHLDIAGPAFAESSAPHQEGGGTGVMVRTLVELARIAE